MPFCSGITAVPVPISGLICAPALSTSHSLTQNSTKSTVADRGGIVGGAGRHQMDVAAAALDLQAGALHGGEMGAARDEGDVGARLRQRRAKSAANSAGADNRDTHQILSLKLVMAGLVPGIHVFAVP